MKILQAFDFLSLPHGGGTVDIIYKLSKALSSRGHEVTICTGDYEIDYNYLSSLDGVGLKLYRSYFNKHGIYLMPGLLKLDVGNYDIVHLHCYRSAQNIILSKKSRANGIPYIIDAHGSTVARSGGKTLLLNTYDSVFGRSLIDHARFVVAETDVGFDEWIVLGSTIRKTRLLHPLLDTSEFDNLPEKGLFRDKYGTKSKFLVMFLGRLHPAKGIDTLVESSRLLRRQGVDVGLVIAGQDDGFKSTLFNMMYNKGTPFVMPGFLTGQDKLSALVDADVLVQPSRNEAGARPSLEAIMVGTPVIVSRDTGAGEVIAGFDCGLLFQSGDAEELANRIHEIIDNPEDARAKTEKSREYIINNLSLDRGIADYEKLYGEAIE